MIDVEAAGVYGAASIQGEYVWNEVEQLHGGSLSLDGYYAQASYFLTGEHRAYKLGEGVFDRLFLILTSWEKIKVSERGKWLLVSPVWISRILPVKPAWMILPPA